MAYQFMIQGDTESGKVEWQLIFTGEGAKNSDAEKARILGVSNELLSALRELAQATPRSA